MARLGGHLLRPPGGNRCVLGPHDSGLQLTEPLLLLDVDEDIALVHHVQQLHQDLLLGCAILRCLQGFYESRRLERGGGGTAPSCSPHEVQEPQNSPSLFM